MDSIQRSFIDWNQKGLGLGRDFPLKEINKLKLHPQTVTNFQAEFKIMQSRSKISKIKKIISMIDWNWRLRITWISCHLNFLRKSTFNWRGKIVDLCSDVGELKI